MFVGDDTRLSGNSMNWIWLVLFWYNEWHCQLWSTLQEEWLNQAMYWMMRDCFFSFIEWSYFAACLFQWAKVNCEWVYFCEGMCSSVWSVQCWASALRHSCYEQACAGNNWKTASWNTTTNITSLISTVMLFLFPFKPATLLQWFWLPFTTVAFLSQSSISYTKTITKKRGLLKNSSHMGLWSNLSFIFCEVCGKLCEYHLLASTSCLHLWLLCTQV